MNFSLQDIIALISKEFIRKRFAIMAIFFTVSMLILTVGWVWPKIYVSKGSIIYNKSILNSVLGNSAVEVDVTGHARNAKEILFGTDVLDVVLAQTGVELDQMTEIQKERQKNAIRDKTSITPVGNNLIRISFSDPDPSIAHKVTTAYMSQLIELTEEKRVKDAQDTFNFIDKKTKKFRSDLTETEKKLKKFRETNIDAVPGTEQTVTTRILQLQRSIETSSIELKEAVIAEEAAKERLSGEAAKGIELAKRNVITDRIVELQKLLDTLRLSYHESYPDIVSAKDKISTLNSQLIEMEIVELSDESLDTFDPVYEEIRASVSEKETLIKTLETRLIETRKLLTDEMKRSIRISDASAQLDELVTQYERNQTNYQNFLSDKDQAQISLELVLENRGVAMKIQEKANYPVIPNGLRLMHFMIIGLVLATIIPVTYLYLQVYLDQKIRTPSQIESEYNIQVLAVVDSFQTGKSILQNYIWMAMWLSVLMVVFGIYGIAIIARTGLIGG